MKTIIICLLLSLVILSCSSSKRIKHLKEEVKTDLDIKNQKIATEIQILHSGSTYKLPSFEKWKKDRKAFILLVEDYLQTNTFLIDIKKKRQNKKVSPLNIDSDNLNGSASVVVATVATMSSINKDRNRKKINKNTNSMTNSLLDFKERWNDNNHPQSRNDLKLYLEEKRHIIEKIKNMECFK
jgi:hypothetical protein